ncbi:hypothetical protein HanIR_Chr14g0709501 [Helianthus annuus]|nr:hypothetical protein HanIR_Chr14g0709501 [Helianthus annuus]
MFFKLFGFLNCMMLISKYTIMMYFLYTFKLTRRNERSSCLSLYTFWCELCSNNLVFVYKDVTFQ